MCRVARWWIDAGKVLKKCKSTNILKYKPEYRSARERTIGLLRAVVRKVKEEQGAQNEKQNVPSCAEA